MRQTDFDVVIIGGGVSGTALLYVLSEFTDIPRIALVEKYDALATVNSSCHHNSQTLHFGDIETNYSVEKAKRVKASTDLVRRFLHLHEKTAGSPKLYSKYDKMVLAVGKREVDILEQRYETIREIFPKLKKIGPDRLREMEPRVMEGRDPAEPVVALVTEDGYTVDFGALARAFARRAERQGERTTLMTGNPVSRIDKTQSGYRLTTPAGELTAAFVIVAAGGHSLYMAHQLGYGTKFSILSIAGSFFAAPKLLNGKVYKLQDARLPFAAIHGDPDVYDADITRFGPTAKSIPLLERYNWKSMPEYFRIIGLRPSVLLSLVNILGDPVIIRYILKNFLYDMPYIGKRLFLKEVRQIVPTLTLDDLNYSERTGGTRPQIINTLTRSLDLGEAKIKGDRIIFNITPSPGASTCLGNAEADAATIADALGFTFDTTRFTATLGPEA